jgi:hypothetical protein
MTLVQKPYVHGTCQYADTRMHAYHRWQSKSRAKDSDLPLSSDIAQESYLISFLDLIRSMHDSYQSLHDVHSMVPDLNTERESSCESKRT